MLPTARLLHLAALALLLAAPPLTVLAQEDPARPVLPDIAPRVVEIRGELEISLPSLQRQPLVGFNPPPRVTPIPPDRRPLTDDYTDAKVALPITPLQPPLAPDVSALARRPPRRGEIESSLGRYVSRLAHARVEAPLGGSAQALVQLDYRGSDGHAPFRGADELRDAYDFLTSRVGLQGSSSQLAYGFDGEGFFNRYGLYGAVASRPNLRELPMRVGTGGALSFWLRPRASSPLDGEARIRYGGARYETALLDDPDADGTVLSERRLDVSTLLSGPLTERLEARFDGRFGGAGLDGASFIGGTRTSVDAAGGVRLRESGRYDITLQARLFGFRSEQEEILSAIADEIDPESGAVQSGFYVSPDVRLDLFPVERLMLYAENRPGLEEHTLASLHRTNPYLVARPALLPTVRMIDAGAGAHVFSGAFEFDVRVGFVHAPQYLFFEHASEQATGGYLFGFTKPQYGEARILSVATEASFMLTQGLNASLGLTVRDGELVGGETASDIPYFGPVLGRGSLSLSLLDGRGLFQFVSTYESARYRDRARSRKIGDYFDLDASFTYDVTPSLGTVVRLENVSGGHLERWDRYERQPFVFMLGFRVLW